LAGCGPCARRARRAVDWTGRESSWPSSARQLLTIGAIKGGVHENIIANLVDTRSTIRSFDETLRPATSRSA
jgi:metal-dependent amidase/aminoacylase/carboxypeptidase family protein